MPRDFQLQGAEAPQQFLEALREADYHDMALVYLERIQNSPSIDDNFRQGLIYEQAMSLVAAARQQTDYVRRDAQLQAALVKFSEFTSQHPGDPRASLALGQQGQLRLEQARIRVQQASNAKTDDEKERFLNDAGRLFTEARRTLVEHKDQIKSQILELRELPADQQDPERRAALRADYVHTLMSEALAQYEHAILETTDEEDRKQGLMEASQSFSEISINYSGPLASRYIVYILNALLYQGKCHQELGEYEKGLELFRELRELEDVRDEAVGSLQAKALTQSLECWMAIGDLDRAIEEGQSDLGQVRASMQTRPEWLRVRLALARVYQAQAKKGRPGQQERLLSQARALVAFVTRFPGPLQREARQLLSELGGPARTPVATARSFEEAQMQGQQALEEMQSASTLIQLATPKLATTNDAERKAELEEQIATATAARNRHRQEARTLFQRALGLATPNTPVDDLNAIRYYLAYLHYDSGDFYDAAVLAGFLAMKYPTYPAAKHCANIARASYINLYTHGDASDQEFAAAKLERLVSRLVRAWPDAPEAGEAVMTLINIMIQQGQLEEAQSYLSKIPRDSVFRGQAQLRTGQALWSAYLRGIRERLTASSGADESPTAAELEVLRDNAQKMLDQGIQHVRQAGATPDLLRATLALSQILVDTGQYDRAIELLEDPATGPLTLVEQKAPVADLPGLASESYKTALRAYIASLPNAADTDQAIARAGQVMEGLKNTVSQAPDGQQRLIAVYISLARELQKQIQMAPPKIKASLAGSFELFLDQVSAESRDLNVLIWVADTFAGLGESYAGRDGTLTPNAKKYLQRAVATYEKIIEAREALELDDVRLLQVQIRLATALRNVQAYASAIEVFATVLGERNSLLNVQIEAARTLQEGALQGDKGMYDLAVLGGKPGSDGKNVIWGWARIAKIAAQQMYGQPEAKEKFRGIFHEARFSIAQLLYEHALRNQNERRKKLLNSAQRGILGTHGLYPEMGGPTWQPRYDDLLKKIQRALGDEPKGLPTVNKE